MVLPPPPAGAMPLGAEVALPPPLEAVAAQNAYIVVDPPPQSEGHSSDAFPPNGIILRATNGHHKVVEGEHPSRGLVDPTVFQAVLRSKLAVHAGAGASVVFDWNSSCHVTIEEICIPDVVSEMTGEVTIPVCIVEEEDGERERRRRLP